MRVDGAAGPLALGAKGSACDRLRLTGGLRAFALGSYVVSLRWRGERPFGRHFLCRLWRRKPYNRPAGVGNASPPLVPYGTTFPPQAVGLWVLSNGAMSLQESIERFILSPGWGKVRRSRIRGSRVAANHQNANHAIWH